MRKSLACFTLLAVLTVPTACGGSDGGGRPSADEIAAALSDPDNPAGAAFATGGTSEEVIDCIAEAIHDSDLSDEAVQAIVDGDEDYAGSGEDDDAITGLSDDITACVTG